MIGWIALAVTAAFIASILLRIDDWGRDWNHNSATLEPDARRAELRPVRLDCSADEAAGRIQNWADSDPRWDVVSQSAGQSDEHSVRMKLTRTTTFMRFVDDVEVEIDADGDGVVITARSQSRVGKGDLGQNPRNLIELTKALRDG